MPRFRPRNSSNGSGSAPATPDKGAQIAERPAPSQPLVSRSASKSDSAQVSDEHRALIGRVQTRLLQQIDSRFETEVRDPERLQRHIARAVDAVMEEDNIV